ncbi:MAG: MqnA/MqnD/SBP family protein [Chlamydiales bacterium]
MLDLALSPCPNDTFLFYPWIHGRVGKIVLRPHFADIEQLNQWALAKKYPLIKLSIACYKEVSAYYELLPVGTALGFHVGPKIIAKESFALEELPYKRIAIPGRNTTAHLLLQKLCPEPLEKHFCLYHEIAQLIETGQVDAGLIIHESRFTFTNNGFCEIVDLGEVWHEKFGLPLPLGGLALQRNHPLRSAIIETIRHSYDYAYAHKEETLPFVLQHAQEIKEAVIQEHIETYVTKESRSLSQEGVRAIHCLIDEEAICLRPGY